MSVTSVTVDPDEKTTISFSSTAWLLNESTTLSSYTLTSSAGVTVVSDDAVLGVVTALITATQSGSVTCHFVFADGQERDRTMTIIVKEK